MANSNYPNHHTVLARHLQATCVGVAPTLDTPTSWPLNAAKRARVRSEKGHRWADPRSSKRPNPRTFVVNALGVRAGADGPCAPCPHG
jgi:hypothetical protein